MSDAIISVEGLGKRYRLGASNSGERYTALRDVIAQKAAVQPVGERMEKVRLPIN